MYGLVAVKFFLSLFYSSNTDIVAPASQTFIFYAKTICLMLIYLNMTNAGNESKLSSPKVIVVSL